MKIKPILGAAVILTAALGIIPHTGHNSIWETGACEVKTAGASLDSLIPYKSHLTDRQLNRMEEYLIGVVAAEMPASYDNEALKAQAVAARTYALRALETSPHTSYTAIGQAYISKEDMKKRWGSSYTSLYNKVKSAVTSTQGIIILYNNEPILAAFCASSNGTTEESGKVWSESLPYLTSVDSHWDTADSNSTQTLAFTEKEITDIFGGIPEVQARTRAGYVEAAMAGGKLYSGIDIRQKLNLKSASFVISQENSKVYFTTTGYGHGVGMSQVGAGGMAKEGNDFEEILLHYYKGTRLGKIT